MIRVLAATTSFADLPRLSAIMAADGFLPWQLANRGDRLVYLFDRIERRRGDVVVTVVLPEFIPGTWWHPLLHNQSALLLKYALLFRRHTVVVSVPYQLGAGVEE